MKNYFLYLLVFSILLGCQSKPVAEFDIIPLLEKAKEDLTTQDTTTLDYDQIKDFEWDGLVVVGPYSHKKHLNHLDLKNLGGVKEQLKIVKNSETKTLILFVNKDEVVRYSLLDLKPNFYFYTVNEGLRNHMKFTKDVLKAKTYVVHIKGYGYLLQRKSLIYDISSILTKFYTDPEKPTEIQFALPKRESLDFDAALILKYGSNINDLKRYKLENLANWAFEINHVLKYNDYNILILMNKNQIIHLSYLGGDMKYSRLSLAKDFPTRMFTAAEIDHKLFIKKNNQDKMVIYFKP